MEEAAAFSALPMEIYGKQSGMTGDDGTPLNDGNNGKEPIYTMAGILHFLQTEWTKFEMERSQWDVERAELQARIAFLQGERKGQENLKHDLVRRIKMLEFALKQERAKFHRLKFGTEPPGVTAADLAKPDLDADEEAAEAAAEAAAVAQLSEDQQLATGTTKDGRQLIRQYLQEMGYADVITDVKQARVHQLLGASAAASAATAAATAAASAEDTKDGSGVGGGKAGGRSIEEQLSSMGINVDDEGSDDESGGPGRLTEEEQVIAEFDFLVNQQDSQPDWGMDERTRSKMADFRKERVRAPKKSAGSGGGGGSFLDEPDRPGSPPPETEPTGPYPTLDDPELRLAVVGGGSSGDGGSEEEGFRSALGLNLGDLQDITVANESDAGTSAESRRTWAAKFSLRSHFDSVRALAFHPTEPALVTASEDSTLKLWNVGKAPSQQQSKKGVTMDLEPIHTFRGHSGPVLCACISDQLLFSGGLDGAVRVWGVPPLSLDPYDAFDAGLVGPVLAGHEDAVWGLAVAKDAGVATLFSIGADRTLRAWRPSQAAGQLLSTRQLPHSPTSVAVVSTDPSKLVVAFQSGQCQLMDAETGQVVTRLADEGAGPANAVLSHPTQNLSIAAHEDRQIRFYDNASRALVHSMVAHLDSVTSLAIDTNGLYMLSGSHDCSIRLWSLDDRTCVQEITAHRKKFDEAIHAVALHPAKSFLASAGADGLAKVFV